MPRDESETFLDLGLGLTRKVLIIGGGFLGAHKSFTRCADFGSKSQWQGELIWRRACHDPEGSFGAPEHGGVGPNLIPFVENLFRISQEYSNPKHVKRCVRVDGPMDNFGEVCWPFDLA